MELVIESGSPDETRERGHAVGRVLRPGDVLLLTGELGGGKTCFAQGIAAGLDVREPVKSSSFILLAEYSGRMPLYHADLFRLTTPEEAADLHLEEYAADGALVVEWPERAWAEMPSQHLLVSFAYDGESRRKLAFVAEGVRAAEIVDALTGAVRSN